MSTSKQLEDHFASLAKGKKAVKNIYSMKQRGRGIGKTRGGKGICSIGQSGSGKRETIVSTAQHLINQAKSEVSHKKRGTKRKRSVSKSAPRSKKRKKSSKKKRRKKTKKKKKSHKKKKNKKRRKSKKKKKDIFD